MKYLVLNTEADALAVVAKIDDVMEYPATGTYRGSTAPDSKQKTLTWTTPRQRATDGKWVLLAAKPKRISAARRTRIKNWLDANVPGWTLEDKQSDWFPE